MPPARAAAVAAKGKAPGRHDLRAPSAGADSLRFVLEQLRKAQLFLRAGDPAQALAALDLLDARVPASVLQEEREVTRTLALCDSGETAEAAALAARAHSLTRFGVHRQLARELRRQGQAARGNP